MTGTYKLEKSMEPFLRLLKSIICNVKVVGPFESFLEISCQRIIFINEIKVPNICLLVSACDVGKLFFSLVDFKDPEKIF